jgi:hypothetical protein
VPSVLEKVKLRTGSLDGNNTEISETTRANEMNAGMRKMCLIALSELAGAPLFRI